MTMRTRFDVQYVDVETCCMILCDACRHKLIMCPIDTFSKGAVINNNSDLNNIIDFT